MKKLILTVVMLAIMTTGAIAGEWQQGEYVDEFGQGTGKHFIFQFDPNGKFSNTATNESNCPTGISTDPSSNCVQLVMIEYGLSKATLFKDHGTLKMKSNLGVKEFRIVVTKGGMVGSCEPGLKPFISDSWGIILCSLKIGNSHYVFKIDANGYNQAMFNISK